MLETIAVLESAYYCTATASTESINTDVLLNTYQDRNI